MASVRFLGGAQHAALLAVAGDAVAFEVGEVGRQRRRAEGAPLMADHPGLDKRRDDRRRTDGCG
jgi:hypothetical protein